MRRKRKKMNRRVAKDKRFKSVPKAYLSGTKGAKESKNIDGLDIKLNVTEKRIQLDPVGNFKGGNYQAPDLMPIVHNRQMGWELKFGDAVAGKNNAGFINYTKGTFERKQKRKNPEQEKAVEQSLQEAINQSKAVEAILREKGVLKPGEDFTSKTKIPLEIHNILSGRGGAKAKMKSESVKVKEDFISDYYNGKGVFYFQMHGKGAYFLGSDPFNIAKEVGMTKLEGEFTLKARVIASSYKVNGKTAGYTYKVIAEPKVSPKSITSKSNFNLDAPGSWKKIMNTKSMQAIGKMARSEAAALKTNKKKVKDIQEKTKKLEKEKNTIKEKVKKTDAKIKDTKKKVKSTKSAKKTISDFKKKYKK